MISVVRSVSRIAAGLAALALALSPVQAQRPLAATAADFSRDHNFSGTILVREHGRTLYSRSFGLADRAFAVPAAADTRYRIASITKLFTAVLILQLAQEGRLDLDAPLRAALPDYPGGGADRVTVHQLLNHTSGLAQWDTVSSYQEAFANGIENYQRPLTAEALLRRCCSGALPGEPGRAFAYNNTDYYVLGRIIERLMGKSFEAALAERILRPLGLRDTAMAHWDRIEPRLAPTYFWRDDQNRLVADMPVYWENWDAAAGMISSAPDLASFADALYGGRLLRPEMLRRLLTPGLDDYGYGLWSDSFTRNGRTFRVAKRPGSVMGANAVLYRLLDRDVTIILLANTNRADLDVFAQRIAEALIDQ
ncbi:MAG TPA: serine hydrolase domain-containing protein [Allosphingosinicella sp.]|nr:serine hydrolase domain-containing protein [Allosphingosinicella sp.]